ncbi:acyltransferase family protein [Spirosoma rhododendri]|uniref:Acyltransferase n=1 Tax=Spirosoma rhododendri TaxID=2728024 RepID=A0A7L5DI51_9BACT|nr:acyltransferase [Spirosoma rhododendri]QJD77031.1 acyltransferase [Spirosoma rhododendri]
MRIDSLTSTRFVVALLLVLFHTAATGLSNDSFIGKLLLAGDSGVSYFFVLSGFILVIASGDNQHLPQRIRKGRFWRNRFARIYPLYLVALTLTFVADVLTHSNSFGRLSLGSVVSSLLLIQAWIPAYTMDLNYPGWSLSAEVFFYALFPVLYAGMVRRSVWQMLAMTILFWGISLAVHVDMVQQMSVVDTAWFHNLTMYFPLLHLNTFLLGMATGFIWVRHRTRLAHYQLGLALALLVMAAVIGYVIVNQLPLLRLRHNGLFAPLFILLILWLSVQSGVLSRWLSRPLPVHLGEISYGIYLLQIPVGTVAFYVNYRWLHCPTWVYLPLYIGLLCGIASLCYRFIETPARQFIRQWTLPRFVRSSDEQLSRPA